MVLALQIDPWMRRRALAARTAMLLLCLCALALASLTLQGCVLFTQSVNSKPSVEILPPNGDLNRGLPITITASVSDPDGDSVKLEWSTSAGQCLEPLDVTQRPTAPIVESPPGDPTFTLTFAPGDPQMVCVWVLATDSQGATAVDARTVSSQDRPPTAVITVLEPSTRTSGGLYELYSTFELSAAASTDPDGDTIRDPMFELVSFPPAVTGSLGACPGKTPTTFVQCLDVGGVAGAYTIALTVSDGLGMSGAAMTTLMVAEDHPACVKTADPDPAVSPIVLDPGEAKTLTIVEILDDGAPLPTPSDGAHATPSFAWTVRRNGGAWQPIVGYDKLNALTLPASSYASGDVVDVNVTISDGVAVHLQAACDPGCPPGCPQSAQWTVDYR